jgi:hypothetical protein
MGTQEGRNQRFTVKLYPKPSAADQDHPSQRLLVKQCPEPKRDDLNQKLIARLYAERGRLVESKMSSQALGPQNGATINVRSVVTQMVVLT